MTVVNPMDYGATGNGSADDLPALQAAVNALPTAGGIVFLPAGKSFKKTNLWTITKNHVKFWSVNRGGELFQAVNGLTRHQSTLFSNTTGCGFFGVKLRSDATARFSALEDNQISADHAALVEVAGCEIQGSAAVGVFLYGSNEHYIEGNYVHLTYADHIHHTAAAYNSWCWGNWIYNVSPSAGDDGIAAVTYGSGAPRCHDMEWWQNSFLHSDGGRGYAVVGGDRISIHDNWARGAAAAGILVAGESNTSASQDVTVTNNFVDACGHVVGHPGILVSGFSPEGPLVNVTLTNNLSYNTPNGPYRSEGSVTNVVSTGLNYTSLPSPGPLLTNVAMADTTVLRTRDVSHAPSNTRAGMYRIHVRQNGAAYQQRFEYVVKATSGMSSFIDQRTAAGDYISETRSVAGTDYAVLLTGTPFTLPGGISGVSFAEMRAGDNDGSLSWLWSRVNGTAY